MTEIVARLATVQSARDRILIAAVSAFSRTGYDGSSLRDIERQAGVNRGLAGYHFRSKEELWRASVSWLMDRFHEELERYQDVLRVVSAQERGRVLLRVLVHFAARYPEYFRLLLLEGSDFSDRSEWLAREHIRRHIDFFRRVADAGDLEDPANEAMAYYSLLGAASTVFAVPAQCRLLFGFDPSDDAFVEQVADRVAALYLSVVPDPSTPGPR